MESGQEQEEEHRHPGTTPLPALDELSFALPPCPEAEALLKVYFELASPTYRFLHRPTVESWLMQLCDNGSISGLHCGSKYVVVLSMLAQASRYDSTAASTNSTSG